MKKSKSDIELKKFSFLYLLLHINLQQKYKLNKMFFLYVTRSEFYTIFRLLILNIEFQSKAVLDT